MTDLSQNREKDKINPVVFYTSAGLILLFSLMTIFFREPKIRAVRVTFRFRSPAFTIWILTVNGMNRRITVGFGRRAVLPLAGHLIVPVIGDITPAGGGPGFRMSLGDGFPTITDVGPGIAAVGAGCRRFPLGGGGHRIKLPSLVGAAATTKAIVMDTATDDMVGTAGARWGRVTGITEVEVPPQSSTTQPSSMRARWTITTLQAE